MATHDIGSTAPTYTTLAAWISYVLALGTLSAPETGNLLNEEHDSGNIQITGGTLVCSASNQLILQGKSGSSFSGNPLRYGDGARILLNASGEEIYINKNHVVLQDVAVKKTSAGSTSGIGVICVPGGVENTIRRVVVEASASTVNVHGMDDRGVAACVRENILVVREGGNSLAGIRCANANKTYLNCGVVAFSSPTGGVGMEHYASTLTAINCYSLGFATDYSTSLGASSKNCATHKSSGSSNCPATGAQFDVIGATEFEAFGTYGSHDMRVKSTSTKIKDVGAASGGASTDIIRNSPSGTQDIGPFEYQAAGGGGTSLPYYVLIRKRGLNSGLRPGR